MMNLTFFERQGRTRVGIVARLFWGLKASINLASTGY